MLIMCKEPCPRLSHATMVSCRNKGEGSKTTTMNGYKCLETSKRGMRVLSGYFNFIGPLSEIWVTVEPSAFAPSPGGLLLASRLHSLPPKHHIQKLVVFKM